MITLSYFGACLAGALMALVLIVLAPVITEKLLRSELQAPLRISSLLLFFATISATQTGVLSGFEQFKKNASANFWSGVIGFPIAVAGAYFWNLNGAVWALAAGAGLNSLLKAFALRGYWHYRSVLRWRPEWVILRDFSLPAAASSAIVAPALWVCNAMLIRQPNGYAEMGLFTAANQWRTALLLIPGSAASVVLPVLASLAGERHTNHYHRVLIFSIGASTAVALLLAAPLLGFSRLIMSSYGPGFETGQSVLILLIISAVMAAANNIIGHALASAGKMWWAFLLNVSWAVTLIALAAIFVPPMGARGLALATVVAYGAHTAFQVLTVKFMLFTRQESSRLRSAQSTA